MSKENLILTIKQNAENEAERIVAEAKEECKNKKDSALSDAQKRKDAILSEAKAFVPVQDSRIMTSAELEVRKVKLKAKQEVLDECFSEALRKIVNMNDKDYIALVSQMIKSQGQNGDEVIISKNDVKRLTPSVLSKIAKELGLELTLSKETGDFAGGIILRQDGCDKNMTVEMELSDIRDRFEAKLSNKLFKDVD